MALILTKSVAGSKCIIRKCSLGLWLSSVRSTLLSDCYTEANSAVLSLSYEGKYGSSFIRGFCTGVNPERLCWGGSSRAVMLKILPFIRGFCTGVNPERLCWGGSSRAVMLKRLETALKEHRVSEVWESFTDFKRLHGFPEVLFVDKLISELCYSSDPYWLQKACDFVLVNVKKRPELLLRCDVLTKLSLSMARCQMPKPAMMILRLMLDKGNLPKMNVLCLVVLHMTKTEVGTHLASNFLIQICHRFQCLREKKSNQAKLLQPDTMIFNLVLDACVRFKLSMKGQQILEMMSAAGVVADAHSIVSIAQIHRMNGQREEIKNYKCYIDHVSAPFVQHYRQFYDSLLRLHFEFNDTDAARELILQLCDDRKSLSIQRDNNSQRPYLVPLGPHNLKSGLNLQIFPELLQKDSVLKVEGKQELVMFKNGKLVLSNRGLARLVTRYKKDGDISELTKLLLKIQNKLCSLRGSTLCSDVIDACIHLGWLETAHDILDDMVVAKAPMGHNTFMSLLAAYYKENMFREAKALLRQMRKSGLFVNLSDEMIASTCLSVVDTTSLGTSTSSSTSKSDLANAFVQEMRDEKKEISSRVYQFNSSINFFCKAKMIDDALKTYRRMQDMKIVPTEETFTFMVNAYSALGMYRDITFLWGDMKRSMENGELAVSRDLYESLLLNFIRGGYFERVIEVSIYMKKHGMFADKWMYKSEFLKLHNHLYTNLKASEAKTDAQRKRLEFVQAFRQWVGIT